MIPVQGSRTKCQVRLDIWVNNVISYENQSRPGSAKFGPFFSDRSGQGGGPGAVQSASLHMNSMKTCHSVTFYFMKISFPDIDRKWILPNMIRAANQSQFTPKMKANAVSRLLSSLV